MKKTLTFFLLVLLSFGIYAQVDLQQDLISLKKQVNSIKYDNNKVKKQITESNANLNLKIITLESIIQSNQGSLNAQNLLIAKNSNDIKNVKETSKSKINFISIIAWSSLILLLIVFAYITFIKMKWNKTKEELNAAINDLKQSIDRFVITTNDLIETSNNEIKNATSEKISSSQLAIEKTIGNNYQTTNEEIASIKSFVQEIQKSNVVNLDNFRNDLFKQKDDFEIALKAAIVKNQSETNQGIALLKDEIEKLKQTQSITIKAPRTRKNPKKV